MDVEDFVEQQGGALLRLAYVLTGDRHRAEDLAQTALADVCRHWRKVSAARDPRAYARRVLVNAHLSAHRRRWTRERPVPIDERDAGTVADPADAVAEREALRSRLAALAPRARTVLVLRYWADLDDAAIADAMGIAPATVRATAARALETLRAAEPALDEGERR